MKVFRTPINEPPVPHKLTLADKFLTCGSCFADVMAEHLIQNKINTLKNPFFAIYNPLSIHKLIQYAVAQADPVVSTYLSHQGIFLNYDFHSTFSSIDQQGLTTSIKNKIKETHQFLKETTVLIITYGTAWIYTRQDNNEIVANCHKQPASFFNKSLLTQKQIIHSFDSIYRQLESLNSNVRIILTVSPVRHIKDTLTGNGVSKALLRTACHTLAEHYPQVDYFPSFEIMMDDLRDYRFYKEDMVHPTSTAENYIWEFFVDHYFDASAKIFFKKWNGVKAALEHRPFHPFSESHLTFLGDTLKKLEELKTWADVSDEIARVQEHLSIHKARG